MIEVPSVILSRVAIIRDCNEDLVASAISVSRAVATSDIGGVVAATFSNRERFPALAIRVANALGLGTNLPAFDLQLACSAYPYAIYIASKLANDFQKPILVVDGDVQSALVNRADHATGGIFSDVVTATIVNPSSFANREEMSRFDFLSREDEALTCSATGPIKMDGFKVFSFVAREVSTFLRAFGNDFDFFVPHQANPYMIRQLAKSLGLSEKLLTIDEKDLNPGSCSVAMALATAPRAGRALIAGFGAGYSASAGIVRLADDFATFNI